MIANFKDKRCLVLCHVAHSWYDFIIKQLSIYFDRTVCLNYSDLFLKRGIAETESEIEGLVEKERIDLIIIFTFANNYELSLGFLSKLKEKAFIVFWFFDDETYFHFHSKFFAQIADAVITADYFSTFSYQQMDVPAIFYYNSHSKMDYFPIDVAKDIDVSFIGACDKRDRVEFVDYLRQNGIQVSLFGKGSTYGPVDHNQMVRLFNRSKINLNFTEMDLPGPVLKESALLPRIRQWKSRPVEVALTKSFCLSEYAPGFEKMFKIGLEIDVFLTRKELLEKIRYYLVNESKRMEMAAEAYEKAIKHYESSVQIPKVLHETMQAIQKNKLKRFYYKDIYKSSAFKKREISFLTVRLVKMLSDANYKAVRGTFFTLFQYGFRIFFIGFLTGITEITDVFVQKANKFLKAENCR